MLSAFLTHAEKWIDIPDKNSEEAYWAKIELLGHVYQAKLYLNEKENAPKKLIQKMEGLPAKYKNMKKAHKAYQVEKMEISSLMQEVLKDEWNLDS